MRPTSKSEVPIGTVLSDRYRISGEIGRGGMAAVYEATHIEIGKRVAVKILDPSLARNDTVIERFNREARAAASVDSPNICEVFDIGRLDDGRPYLVMELLEGESLYERMVREVQLKIVDAVRILSQVGRGLARAHAAGIVHRDLKPENIFLHRNAEGEEIVKIVDFGLAKFHAAVSGTDERLTREGAIFGTPLYMSPEQVSGQGHADHRSDLWALGCIVFECLTGRSLWPVDRGMAYIFAQIVTEPIPVPSSLRPDLPRAFDVWFNRALQRDPSERYQSAQQMVVDLASALGHDPSGLVSAPAIMPSFSADVSHVVVNDPRPLASTAGDFVAMAPTEPPPEALAPTEPPLALAPTVRPDSPTSRTPKSKFGGWMIGAVASAAVVGAGLGVATWFVVTSGPAPEPATSALAVAPSASVEAVASAPSAASPSGSAAPLPAWASSIRQAQRLMANGRTPAAVTLLERSVERSDHPALLTMLDQARIAAATTGPCSVIAFGRPRPYDAQQPARTAFAMPVSAGVLVGWTSAVEESSYAHIVHTDLELQATGTPTDAAPGARHVVGVSFARAEKLNAFLFVDSEGERRGPWLQLLGEQGALEGSAMRIATHPGARSNPSSAADPQGHLWIAYTDRTVGRTLDLFLRRFAQDKLSEPVRITSHGAPDGGDGRDAAAPRIAFAGNQVVLAYIRQTLRENEVVVHRAGALDDVLAGKPRSTPSEDGDATIVTETTLKVLSPSLACDGQTCFVGWRNQPSGSHVAAVDATSGEIVWRKTFASAGTDVTVAARPGGGALMVWFDRGRLRSAPLTRDGLGATSVLARVHGEQSAPTLVPDTSDHDWLTAWTCFEGGRPEVFVARLRCQ